MHHLIDLLFSRTWAWWAAGLGLGLTAFALAWFTQKRLGVTGGFEDACSVVTQNETSFSPSPSKWKLWFILGLPLGGVLANLESWNWTLLYGQLDEVVFGSFVGKVIWLLVGGFLVGFGARWAGGCTSGHGIMGVAQFHKASLLMLLAFMVAGILVANILFKVV